MAELIVKPKARMQSAHAHVCVCVYVCVSRGISMNQPYTDATVSWLKKEKKGQ